MSLKDYNEYSIGELIEEFVAEHKGCDFADELRVVRAWPQAVGSYVARQTTDITIKDGVLYVTVNDPALRFELLNRRNIIIKDLNTFAKTKVLKKILFR